MGSGHNSLMSAVDESKWLASLTELLAPSIISEIHRRCVSLMTDWIRTLSLPWPVTVASEMTGVSSGHFMYTTSFNIKKFHVLPTQCIYVFCVDLRRNSDYFPIQH